MDWEAVFAPYDAETYQFVVDRIQPHDVVLDIGAGDLRLARRLAALAQRVYAVERNPGVLSQSDRSARPDNLIVVCEDALTWPFPRDVTVGVLLMRHCTHTADYIARLKAIGSARLITNARWKMGVEEIDLRSGVSYDPDRVGWYACACGGVGFTSGDPDMITPQMLNEVIEVTRCPYCGA